MNDYQKALADLVRAYHAYKDAKQLVNECIVAVLKEKHCYPVIRDMKTEWKELGLEQ